MTNMDVTLRHIGAVTSIDNACFKHCALHSKSYEVTSLNYSEEEMHQDAFHRLFEISA